MTFKPCLVIPFFNHGQFTEALINGITRYKLPVFVVDDGSDAAHKDKLCRAMADHPDITLVTLTHNQGKGSAVIAGFQQAVAQGYTHALQVDADCQHDFGAIPTFLQAAEKQPEAVICGYPIYDHSVPKSRLYPRYITHFWVCLNTLSRAIKDSMCGFRCYPLAPTMAMLARHHIGRHMDFDIEIIVRLYWQNLPIDNLPVQVIYHDVPSSHFRLWKDNVLISRAHALLFFGLLKRLPRRLLTGQFS